ncbi:conjugal transfer protein TraG, partial [Escherichia coli]|nr:conjugal transfer protein TraG [Escherichia coli]
LNFLTFWWELARWLDSWMLTALYSSDTHSRVNMMGLQNTSDDIIMNFVMGTMFIILPAVWLGALSWAGISAGVAIANAARDGTSAAHQAASKAGDLVGKVGNSLGKNQ